MSMYRRLLVVISSTMIEDPNWRGIVTSTLCVFYFGYVKGVFHFGAVWADTIFLARINIYTEPYRNRGVQLAASLSLFVLAVISVSSMPQLARRAYGAGEKVLSHIHLFRSTRDIGRDSGA